jgi:hypothetical protein
MPELTPDLVAAALEDTWGSDVEWLDGDPRARVTGNQTELARRLASGLAHELALPLLQAGRPTSSRRPYIRWTAGDPDLARPARIWLSTCDPAGEHELARARWLPRSIYRALGFLLHAQRDAKELALGRRESDSPYPRWVFLVDTVGVIEQTNVDVIASREPPVRARAWTLRHGQLSSEDAREA